MGEKEYKLLWNKHFAKGAVKPKQSETKYKKKTYNTNIHRENLSATKLEVNTENNSKQC
jgi:hypothetical protein